MTGQPPATDERSPRYPGWRVVAVCFAMALFGWGFGFYGHAVYLAEMHRAHGWPTSLIAGASTLFYLWGAILVAFVGDAIARLGTRRFVLAGVATMAASAALLPLVTQPWQLFAVYFVMAFAWAALGLGAIANILGLWFSAKRGLAISLALNGASLSGVIISPAMVMVSASFGFQAAIYAVTLAMLLVLVPLAVLWLKPASARPLAGGGEGARPAPGWTKAQALCSPHFWSVAAPFALAITAQVGFIVHQIAFLEPMIGRAEAGWAVAVTTAMAVVGRVGLGTVIDRLNQRLASAVSFASHAVAFVIMTQTSNPTVLLLACALFGFSVGNLITFPSLILQREFDAARFGMLAALVTAISQFTYSFGPAIVGLVRDASGGYALALLLCAAADLLAAALILLARPRPGA